MIKWIIFVGAVLGNMICSGCATQGVQSRQYRNMGNLKRVMIYEDPLQVSDECVSRSGGVNDHGRRMNSTNACSDVKAGTVRIAATATVKDFLHELCHIDNVLSRALCAKGE